MKVSSYTRLYKYIEVAATSSQRQQYVFWRVGVNGHRRAPSLLTQQQRDGVGSGTWFTGMVLKCCVFTGGAGGCTQPSSAECINITLKYWGRTYYKKLDRALLHPLSFKINSRFNLTLHRATAVHRINKMNYSHTSTK